MEKKNNKNNNSKRSLIMKFRVSPDEAKLIEERAAKTNLSSISAYLRKMAITGVIVNVNLTELTELNKSLINIGANINQIARRVNSTNRFYEDDIKYIMEVNDEIWQSLKSVQSKLRSL